MHPPKSRHLWDLNDWWRCPGTSSSWLWKGIPTSDWPVWRAWPPGVHLSVMTTEQLRQLRWCLNLDEKDGTIRTHQDSQRPHLLALPILIRALCASRGAVRQGERPQMHVRLWDIGADGTKDLISKGVPAQVQGQKRVASEERFLTGQGHTWSDQKGKLWSETPRFLLGKWLVFTCTFFVLTQISGNFLDGWPMKIHRIIILCRMEEAKYFKVLKSKHGLRPIFTLYTNEKNPLDWQTRCFL